MNPKQRLSALERQFSLADTQPQCAPEEAARRQRMGMSAHNGPVHLMPPADIRRIGEILRGKYPETMTADDIEWIHETHAELEAAL